MRVLERFAPHQVTSLAATAGRSPGRFGRCVDYGRTTGLRGSGDSWAILAVLAWLAGGKAIIDLSLKFVKY
jgi:hypothetical protein